VACAEPVKVDPYFTVRTSCTGWRPTFSPSSANTRPVADISRPSPSWAPSGRSKIGVRTEWAIPVECMKMRKPHIVPLSKLALAVLRQVQAMNGNYQWVFASPTKPRRHMSNNTILKALERLCYKGRMSGHGFHAMAMMPAVAPQKRSTTIRSSLRPLATADVPCR
jgi:hypothetical protein